MAKITLDFIREKRPHVEWAQAIWFKYRMPKQSFLAWLAVHDRLSTGEKMRRWSAMVNVRCVFCNHPLENRDHLFFDCVVTQKIWEELAAGLFGQEYTYVWYDIIRVISF